MTEFVRRMRERRGIERVIAYFQPATNTYGPVEYLERCYREAMSVPGVVGLAIGTRPDCLPDAVLDLLVKLNREIWLSVEIGVQSSHNKTLQQINRGHSWEDSVRAIQRCADRGIRTTAHLMFGLPGESRAEMLETAERIAQLPIEGVKLHNLYVAKDTKLADLYENGHYQPLSQKEYIGIVADVLERLPPDVVIERLTAETSDDYLIAPDWCRRKSETIELVHQELVTRDTYQGRQFRGKYPPIGGS